MTSINRQIFRDSVIVTALGILGQVLGYMVTMLVAKFFGANWITDAYYFAAIIPGTFAAIISGVVRLVVVPVFVEERIKNPESFQDTIGATISITIIVSCIGMIMVAILSYSDIFSFGQNQETKALTRILLLELLPLIPFTIIAGVFGAVYNSFQRFGLAELANLVNYVVTLLALIFFTKSFGIHPLIFGNVIGQFLTLLLSGWIVYKKLGVDIRPRFTFNAAFKRMMRLSFLPFLTYTMALFNPLISRIIASHLTSGSISVIGYAEKIAIIPSMILGTGFMGVLVSHWSKTVAEGDEQQLQKSLNRSVSLLIMVLAPIVVGLFILREPLIRLLLQRGAFNEEAVVITTEIFSILVIAVIPTYLHMVIGRIFYIKKDMVSLFLVTSLGMGFHLLLSYFFAIMLGKGPAGIAVSNLISMSIVAFTTTLLVHKRYIRFSMDMQGGNILKALAGCILMSLCIYLFQYFGQELIMKWGLVLKIFSVTLIGGAIYIGFLWLVHHPDLIAVSEMVFGSRKLFSR